MSVDLTQKGMLGGLCNRSACLAPGAGFFNRSTRRYYCEACSISINELNAADSLRLYGDARLCIPAAEAARLGIA